MTHKRPNNPCAKDCPRRNGTCHASCPDYSDFVIANEAFKKELAQEKLRTEPNRIWYKHGNYFRRTV